MAEKFKMLDMFGQTVNLTWNGEDKFKTTFGAGVTLVLMILLVVYFGLSAKTIADRNGAVVTKISLIRSAADDATEFNP